MIELRNTTKQYNGVRALDNISLKIASNGIYCLLGRNGAGKTTFMKLLAGHIGASSGDVAVDGKQVSTSQMPSCVTYIESGSEQFNMRVYQLLDAAADIQPGFDRDFAREMTARLELNPNKKFKQLSFGMKTMLTTIMTLANNAKVVLLDEPTLGFDAIMRDQFNTLLLESYHAHPRVIIVSTHMIDDIAKVTERLMIINNGRLLIEAGIDDIDEKAYTLTGPAQKVLPLIEKLNVIGKTTAGSITAAHIYGGRITPPEGVTLERLSLHDFFVNIVGGQKHD